MESTTLTRSVSLLSVCALFALACGEQPSSSGGSPSRGLADPATRTRDAGSGTQPPPVLEDSGSVTPVADAGEVVDAGVVVADAGVSAPAIEHVVLIVIDGMRRSALYNALNAGELPNFARIVGSKVGAQAFSTAMLLDAEAIFPTITLATTAAIYTGKTPGETGIYGNEFFDRMNSDFIGFVASSFSDIPDFVGIYMNTGLANDTLTTETIYEKAKDQRLSSTVVFGQYSRGADRWITPLDLSLLASTIGSYGSRGNVYAEANGIDQTAVDRAISSINETGVPNILTVYFMGNDHYAHQTAGESDEVQRGYLKTSLDGHIGRLITAIEQHGVMNKTAFVVVADHGHTDTVSDADHAIVLEGESNNELEYLIESVCENGGCYDVKDTLLEVSYSAVTGLNGGMAYIYLRNRENDDWSKPARYEKDVLAAANAFYQANQTGRYTGAPGKNFDFIKGKVDMILVRDTESANTFDGPPYVVYLGKNATGQHQTESVAGWLVRNPRPSYSRMDERLRGLTRGRSASRTGDILLIPKYGEPTEARDRSYFGAELESWHGGMNADDIRIPLIIARPGAPQSATSLKVASELSSPPMHTDVPKIVLKLLEDARRP